MKKWMLMVLVGLLTMSLSSVLAGSESVFTHEFDPAQGDEALHVCADGEGGFYVLSRDKLLRWRPGDEKMDVIGLNEHGFSYLACRGNEVYSMSTETGLYKFEDGEWLGLGIPGWYNPDEINAQAGANRFLGNAVIGKDRVFFFSVDADQEMHYLSAYHLDSGEFTVDAKAVFSRAMFAYDEVNDMILGAVQGDKGGSFLARYDCSTGSIAYVESDSFSGDIMGYDSARSRALFSSYWGAMLGLSDKDVMKIPGTPMRNSNVALLDDGYLVYAVGRRDGENARVVVLRYDPERLERVD